MSVQDEDDEEEDEKPAPAASKKRKAEVHPLFLLRCCKALAFLL